MVILLKRLTVFLMSLSVRGGQRNVPIGLRRGDRLLARDEEPSLGAHLVTPRFAFAHHGIYIGGGRVVHYGSLAHPWRRKPVEEVSLRSFAQHHELWIRAHATPRFAPEEVIGRARSRLGEDEYRLLSNNCEHFCEWCVQGEHRSYQVDVLVALAYRSFTSRRSPSPPAARDCSLGHQ